MATTRTRADMPGKASQPVLAIATRPGDPTPVSQINPPDREPSVVYHNALKMVLLFGGRTVRAGAGKNNDLWTWNGLRWLQLPACNPAPAPHDNASIAYDSTNDKVLLFGGLDKSTRILEPDELGSGPELPCMNYRLSSLWFMSILADYNTPRPGLPFVQTRAARPKGQTV